MNIAAFKSPTLQRQYGSPAVRRHATHGGINETPQSDDFGPFDHRRFELGLVGLFHRDVVASILGATSTPARLVYILIGLSALWQLIPLFMSVSTDEPTALRGLWVH